MKNGPWLTDWSGPPVNANYLAFGYTGGAGGRLVLFGWLYNVGQPDPTSAQVIGKLYFGSLDADGAKKVAREFAADILQQFGAKSLAGTKIYFVSDRSGAKEIWSMDYDGSNQQQLTHYKSTSTMPAVSPDGKMFAFTTYAQGQSEDHGLFGGDRPSGCRFTIRFLRWWRRRSSRPTGSNCCLRRLIDGWVQICIADVDGGNMRRISHVRAIEVSPKVNPKNRHGHAVHLRARRPPAALADEHRRRRHGAAHHRRGRRRESVLESQRTAHRVCLDARL